jgi:hypothetical protein
LKYKNPPETPGLAAFGPPELSFLNFPPTTLTDCSASLYPVTLPDYYSPSILLSVPIRARLIITQLNNPISKPPPSLSFLDYSTPDLSFRLHWSFIGLVPRFSIQLPSPIWTEDWNLSAHSSF